MKKDGRERADGGVRWLTSHWDEGDVLYLFKVDVEGEVLRQIELDGPEPSG